MSRTRSTGRDGGRSARRRLAPLLLLATVLTGCGGPSPPPVKEGRSAFSYDDDEIDPANLPARKGPAGSRGRR